MIKLFLVSPKFISTHILNTILIGVFQMSLAELCHMLNILLTEPFLILLSRPDILLQTPHLGFKPPTLLFFFNWSLSCPWPQYHFPSSLMQYFLLLSNCVLSVLLSRALILSYEWEMWRVNITTRKNLVKILKKKGPISSSPCISCLQYPLLCPWSWSYRPILSGLL